MKFKYPSSVVYPSPPVDPSHQSAMPLSSASQDELRETVGNSSSPPASSSLSIRPGLPETEPLYVVVPSKVSWMMRVSCSSRVGWDAPLSERTRLYASVDVCSVMWEGKNLHH